MNWYKLSYDLRNSPPIAIVSYSQDGRLGISFDGGDPYHYYDVSPFQERYIRKLLSVKNYGYVRKLLPNFSRPDLHPKPEKTQENVTESPKSPVQQTLWDE